MTQVEGDGGAGYVTAEELIPESSAPPTFGPASEGGAEAQAHGRGPDIMQALAALSTQVQSLAKAGLGSYCSGRGASAGGLRRRA